MSRQRVSQISNALANISTTACGGGQFAPSAVRSSTGRSNPSGCWTKFSPTPITTASPDRSSNIPHSLAPSTERMSLGHLMTTGTCGAICVMVSMAASAMMKANDGAGGSSGRSRTIVLANRLPDGLSHTRPIRPRPPSCASARSQRPSGAPNGTRSKRLALVEPVSATSSKAAVRIAPSRLGR